MARIVGCSVDGAWHEDTEYETISEAITAADALQARYDRNGWFARFTVFSYGRAYHRTSPNPAIGYVIGECPHTHRKVHICTFCATEAARDYSRTHKQSVAPGSLFNPYFESQGRQCAICHATIDGKAHKVPEFTVTMAHLDALAEYQ